MPLYVLHSALDQMTSCLSFLFCLAHLNSTVTKKMVHSHTKDQECFTKRSLLLWQRETGEKRTAAKQAIMSALRWKRLRAYRERCDVFHFYFSLRVKQHFQVMLVFCEYLWSFRFYFRYIFEDLYSV